MRKSGNTKDEVYEPSGKKMVRKIKYKKRNWDVKRNQKWKLRQEDKRNVSNTLKTW